MRKQTRRKQAAYQLLAAIVVLAAATLFGLKRADDITKISSAEVDSHLYQRLDVYTRSFAEVPGMAKVLTKALSEPDRLTEEQRRQYVIHERRFFNTWEAAWEYRETGRLDADRFRIWDEWYIGELRRRPEFVWQDNRQHFPEEFVLHVDEAIGTR